jgi:hypothetical protein
LLKCFTFYDLLMDDKEGVGGVTTGIGCGFIAQFQDWRSSRLGA